MRIALHDAERDHMPHKTFPNYALMKISAYHKSLGDTVEWWNGFEQYDRVYSSKVFDFTPENAYLPPDTIKGGTGYGIFENLPEIIDQTFPDYSIYPDCDYAIGYLFDMYGASKSRIFIYVLVRKDVDDAAFRVSELNKMCKSWNLYAQAERNEPQGIIPDKMQLEFAQRYVYRRLYKHESWQDYCRRKNFHYKE